MVPRDLPLDACLWVQPHIERNEVVLTAYAPIFPLPAYVVRQTDLDVEPRDVALTELPKIAECSCHPAPGRCPAGRRARLESILSPSIRAANAMAA